MPEDPLQRQLQFVTGKGGVGKSVVAAAIAWRLARDGRRVLLLQINAEDSHSGPLEVAPIDASLREVLPGLHAANTTPMDALREYGMIVLRFRAVYNAVFENRLIKYFLRFIPSLAELNMLGKAWYHLGTESSHDQVFDHVIVDAPATGHGVSFIRVARVVADGAVAGPLQRQAAAMAATIEDPERTAVHVVCLPEQLAVEEAEELARTLRQQGSAPLGVGVINRFGPHLFRAGDHELLACAQAQPGGEQATSLALGLARARREQAERALAEQVRQRATIDWREVPDLVEPIRRRAEVEEIGGLLFGRDP